MRTLLIVLSLVFSIRSEAQVQRYEKNLVRALLMELTQKPPSRVEVIGEFDSPAKKAFVDFYLTNVHPKLVELENLSLRYYAFMLITDSGSYENDEELAKLTADLSALSSEWAKWSVDSEWTNTLREWARLAEGLDGQLVRDARRMARNRDLTVFPEDMKEQVAMVDRLGNEMDLARARAPSAARQKEFRQKLQTLRREFKDGLISFDEAFKRTNELVSTAGPHFIGYEAVQATGDNLNRAAILRSELAKKRGFPTWAAYKLEANGQGYTEAFRGVENQERILVELMTGLKPMLESFIDHSLKRLGLSERKDEIRLEHVALLIPPALGQLQVYFPPEKITDIWEEVLIESGFNPQTLRQIIVDDQYRANKNATSAYMAPVQTPETGVTRIDARTLDYIIEPKDSPAYKPGLIYILQNYSGGVGDLTTNFHEGGHALEALLNFHHEMTDVSNGYIEVPSMSAERIASDPLVLWHKLIPVDGEPRPTLESIQEKVKNDELADVFTMAHMVSSSLYDLRLWNYDYSAPGAKTYMERVKELSAEIERQAGFPPSVESSVPTYYTYVATPHYTSGEVRNIGYVYAEIASRMIAKHFLDRLEQLTGRRTFYNQPLLAKLLTEELYEAGRKDPFPVNIEKITGKKFDPRAVIRELNDLMMAMDCEERLRH